MSGKHYRSLFDNPVRGWLYLFPGLAVYLLFFIFPVLRSLLSSFFKYETMFSRTFSGTENYLKVMKDTLFWGSLSHNGILILFLMKIFMLPHRKLLTLARSRWALLIARTLL